MLILLALGAYLYFKPGAAARSVPVSIRTAKVFLGTLRQTVRVSGQTAARDYATIIAPLIRGPESGRSMILMKLVTAGSRVKKGQLLASMDAQPLRDHIDDVNDIVRQAASDVSTRQAEQAVEWNQLQQTALVAKADMDKANWDVKATEIRTPIDQEILKLSAEETAARYKETVGDLKMEKASEASEVRLLELTLERHKRHLARHVGDLRRFTIYAPMDGLAVMSTIWRGGDWGQVQEGDLVWPGQLFMKIVNTQNMQVEASINQAESSEFRIGQPADVTLDAFPGVHLKGKVYSIGALAVGGRRSNYFIRGIPVRIAIEGTDPRLIPDLSAAGDVEIRRADNVPIVRRSALDSEGSTDFVYVKQGGSFVRRDVQLGLENETEAAVVDGLAPGDEVRLNSGY